MDNHREPSRGPKRSATIQWIAKVSLGIRWYMLHDATCKHCSLLQLVWTIGKICKMIRSGSGPRMGPRPTCHLLRAPEKPGRLGVSTAPLVLQLLAVPSICQPQPLPFCATWCVQLWSKTPSHGLMALHFLGKILTLA